MIDSQKVLDFMKEKGPIIPSQIAKELRIQILFSSAVLSELRSKNKVKISNVKVGGTPLYYLPGQEEQLLNFLSNLNEKDQKTVEFLKNKKVLSDNSLDPLTRVSLRNIKDFAIPLQVNIQGDRKLFWKWYLVSDEETYSLIKQIIYPETEKTLPEKVEERIENEEIENEEKIKQESIQEDIQEDIEEDIQKLKEKSIENKKPEKIEKKVVEKQKTIESTQNNSDLDDEFYNLVKDYSNENSIRILKVNVIKKNSEIDMYIQIITSIGNLNYFCKAKKKKYISDGDLSSAYLTAQNKKLPALLITTGKLSKKAKEMIKDLKGMHIVEI